MNAIDPEGRNAKGEIAATTLNVPTGLCAANGVLAVADAWNHRILLWFSYPARSNQPADLELGQADFCSGLANRGRNAAGAETLNWDYGVAICGDRLVVADTGNRRVLVWNKIPRTNGAPEDLVLGQRDFTRRDENAGAATGPVGMRWPHGIATLGDTLLVSDAGNNRVMAWRGWPERNGAACEFVLGQAAMSGTDHNRNAYGPTAGAMCMPYGLTVLRDSVNNRVLLWDAALWNAVR
jgi:hypothetical protein